MSPRGHDQLQTMIPQHTTVQLNDKNIHVLLFNYTDRIFVMITENGRIGEILDVSSQPSAMAAMSAYDDGFHDTDSMTVQTLLGRRDDFVSQVIAQSISEQLSKGSTLPKKVTVGLGIKSKDMTFDASSLSHLSTTIKELLV